MNFDPFLKGCTPYLLLLILALHYLLSLLHISSPTQWFCSVGCHWLHLMNPVRSPIVVPVSPIRVWRQRWRGCCWEFFCGCVWCCGCDCCCISLLSKTFCSQRFFPLGIFFSALVNPLEFSASKGVSCLTPYLFFFLLLLLLLILLIWWCTHFLFPLFSSLSKLLNIFKRRNIKWPPPKTTCFFFPVLCPSVYVVCWSIRSCGTYKNNIAQVSNYAIRTHSNSHTQIDTDGHTESHTHSTNTTTWNWNFIVFTYANKSHRIADTGYWKLTLRPLHLTTSRTVTGRWERSINSLTQGEQLNQSIQTHSGHDGNFGGWVLANRGYTLATSWLLMCVWVCLCLCVGVLCVFLCVWIGT